MGAILAGAGLVAKIGKRLKGRAQLQHERRALMDEAEDAAIQHQPVPAENFEGYTDPVKYLQHQAAGAARHSEKEYAKHKLANIAAHHSATSHAATIGDSIAGVGKALGSPTGLRTVGAIARGLSARRRRASYYTDSYGVRRRRRASYASEEMAPEEEPSATESEPEGDVAEGLVPSAEHVAAGGTFGIQGATPAKLAGVAAAGVGAYLVTRALLTHFGNQVFDSQTAGIQASIAFREARAEYKREHGATPTGSQLASMKEAWIHKLAELGYTTEGGAVEYQPNAAQRFLESYSNEEE